MICESVFRADDPEAESLADYYIIPIRVEHSRFLSLCSALLSTSAIDGESQVSCLTLLIGRKKRAEQLSFGCKVRIRF